MNASPKLLAATIAATSIAAATFSPARADPQVQLDQCIGLDRGELALAIDEELASSLSGGGAKDLVIAASCDDGVTATVRISERGSKRKAERSLALGEVTGELRPRLVALVAVELVESVLAAPPAPLEPFADLSALEAKPPSPAQAAEPAPAPEGPPPGLASALVLRSMDRRPVALSVGLGTRVYFEQPDPMLQLTLELDLPIITLGIVGARGAPTWVEEEFVGGAEPRIEKIETPYSTYLGGVALRGQFFCVRGQERSICLEVHGEAGMIRAYAANLDKTLPDSAFRGTYLLAGVALEGRWPIGPVEAALRAELANSDGYDVMTGDRTIMTSSGALAMVNLGLRWMP